MIKMRRPSSQELQFYASLTQTNSQSAGQRIAPDQSAEQLLRNLDYHGITMLALESGNLDSAVRELIDNRKTMMVANEALKQNTLVELFKGFQSSGLDQTVLFKGTALAYSVYQQPWFRPRSDSDCLIDAQQLKGYEQVFSKLGYQKLFAIEGRYLSYQSTFSKRLSSNSVLNIDLHQRISNRQILAGVFTAAELFEHGVCIEPFGKSINIPSPVDSILIACLHRLGHHHTEERIIWLYDIHLLAENLDTQNWQSLLNRARTKNISAITLDALLLCRQLFGTQLPAQALQEFNSTSQETETSSIFLNRDLPEWRYVWADLKSMPSIAAALCLVWENLFPNPDYIRRQMQTRSAVWGYLKRFWRGFKRLLIPAQQ
jgi:hypothetical protein